MSNAALQNERDDLFRIIVAFAAIYIIWGTTYLAIRIAVSTIPAFLMAGARFLLAGAITFAFLRVRGIPLPSRAQWGSAGLVGAFLLVGGNGFVTWSEQELPSSVAALVVASVPMWMSFMDWLLYRRGNPGKQVMAGLVLGFIGIGLLIGPGQLRTNGDYDVPSLIILFLAPVLWSFGSLRSRQANLPDNVFMSTAAEMLVGGALLVSAGLVTGEGGRLNLAEITPSSLAAMLYLTVFGSIVALTAYAWLLRTVPAAKVATYTYVNPVLAVFLGWLILGEPITVSILTAMVIIVVAVVLITTKKQEHRERPAAPEIAQAVVPCETAGD